MTRDEAIKIINCYDIGFYDLSGEKITADKLADAFGMAIEALKAQGRPKGKWENDKHDIPRCSECGYMPDYNDFIDDYYYSDFCPNCGSDMRGDDD